MKSELQLINKEELLRDLKLKYFMGILNQEQEYYQSLTCLIFTILSKLFPLKDLFLFEKNKILPLKSNLGRNAYKFAKQSQTGTFMVYMI